MPIKIVVLSRLYNALPFWSEETIETVPTSNVGPSKPSSESVSVLAARQLSPTPVVTRSGDVSRTEMTSTMILRSQIRGCRNSAAIPEVETRPEMESRQEIENPAEVVITIPTTDRDLATARPRTAENL